MAPNLQMQQLNLTQLQGTSISSQISSQLGNLTIGSNGNFKIGDILAGINDIEAISSDNDQQRAAGIQSAINDVMSLLQKFVTNGETTAATTETAKNQSKSQKTAAEADNAKNELETGFSKIQTAINGESEQLQSLTGDAEEVNKELEEEKEKIQSIITDIQAKQAELAATTDPAQQQSILVEIQGLSGQLQTCAANIATLQQTAQSLSEKVQATVDNIEELNAGAFELQENGKVKLTQLSQELAQENSDNASTQGKAAGNEITGEAAQKAATAASSNFITGSSLAPKLYQVAADQKGAATVRQSGAQANLATIQQGIGKLSNASEVMDSFSTSIGSSLNQYIGYIGDWNNVLDPMITSFGSIDNMKIGDSIKNLNTAVTEDLGTINSQNETQKDDSNPSSQKQSRSSESSTQPFKWGVSDGQDWTKKEQLNELKTPKVAFGL